jgi:hypothetical protein
MPELVTQFALIETLKNEIINDNNMDMLRDEAVTIQSCFQPSANNVSLMQFCDVAKVVIIDRNVYSQNGCHSFWLGIIALDMNTLEIRTPDLVQLKISCFYVEG